ncbi:hypothetical protein ADEAN_000772400 [Angomonas deanei]|uniref:Uncharacterized protein n=1 Tax=Angomonas deanei TaxID=59799 RepID=A0A7G2CLB1_9TRYP|nr:hypothetical protein ADEAN_000772400 [Angomonas deanei]
MRKKHFLKYVKQHFPQVDSPHHKYDYAARDEHNTNTVLPLSDRLGPILLLNTAEIKCSELLIQEIVAPMFFTLCEPIGLEELRKKQQQQQQQGEEENNMTDENGPAPPEEPSAHHNGANKWFKFLRVSAPSSTPPLAPTDGKSRQHISKKDEKVQQREEELLLEYNVEMRRLFGRTLERMTNQTCSCLLALIPPDPTRHSKTANLPDSSREVVQQLAAQAGKVFQPLTVEEEKEREALYGSVGAEVPAVEDGLLSSSEDEAVVVPPAKAPPADQTSWEQRVWSRTVLLNVTLPPRHISLLQSNLFFKAQLNSQNLTGSNSEFLVK